MSRLSKPNRNRNSGSVTADPLSPPRPFFFASDTARSSASESSLSDSDREQQQPASPRSPPLARSQQPRRRSGIMASSSSSPYAPVASTTPIATNFSRRRNSNGAGPSGVANPFEAGETGYAYNQDHDTYAPIAVAGAEDHELSPSWNANNLYYNDVEEPVSPGRARTGSRPPPSSFQFPFQAHPGNPDPLPTRRRSNSFESLTTDTNHWNGQGVPQHALSDNSHDGSLPQPTAPFMAAGDRNSMSSSSISGMANPVYRGSAAAAMMSPSQTALHQAYLAGAASAAVSMQDLGGAPAPLFAAGSIPRTSSQTFRTPFLSPASRPSSSLWSPPSYVTNTLGSGTNGGSSTALALPAPPAPAPSTRLAEKLSKDEKPWLQRSAPRARVSWWLTALCMLIGLAGAALLAYFGMASVEVFKDSQLCAVMSDDFSNGLDLENTWTREVQLGGFGNAEFQIASSFDNVSYVKNQELYIYPQLTSDWLGESTVETGTVTLDPCTQALTNATACTASGNGVNSVINPVMSARISTIDHFNIQYGRVEVVAKIPRGDWLWPAIWMLPVNGTWPEGGEMDIMEARGNGPEYAAQGSNFVRSTVQYGPFAALVARLFGWYGLKRTSFDKGFHTYGVEWDEQWMRFYVDTRVHTTLDITTKTTKQSFWNRAGFPTTAQNGSGIVAVENPYQNINSPFDQPFYLIIDLAVGGTSGWFPDGVGNKPWFDGSLTAMYDFWTKQSTWYATWPSEADRSFRISSVKMWKKC